MFESFPSSVFLGLNISTAKHGGLTAGRGPGLPAELVDLMKTRPAVLKAQEALQTQLQQTEEKETQRETTGNRKQGFSKEQTEEERTLCRQSASCQLPWRRRIEPPSEVT